MLKWSAAQSHPGGDPLSTAVAAPFADPDPAVVTPAPDFIAVIAPAAVTAIPMMPAKEAGAADADVYDGFGFSGRRRHAHCKGYHGGGCKGCNRTTFLHFSNLSLVRVWLATGHEDQSSPQAVLAPHACRLSGLRVICNAPHPGLLNTGIRARTYSSRHIAYTGGRMK